MVQIKPGYSLSLSSDEVDALLAGEVPDFMAKSEERRGRAEALLKNQAFLQALERARNDSPENFLHITFRGEKEWSYFWTEKS